MKYFTSLGLLAVILLMGCGGKDEPGHVFKLEMGKGEEGNDVLILTIKDLPELEQEDDMYEIYQCWIDHTPPTAVYEFERKMEWFGTSADKSWSIHTSGLTEIYGIKGNTYYGRGRVCAIAVSKDRTLVSNVVTVPNQADAGAPQ